MRASLTNESIDRACEEIERFLTKRGGSCCRMGSLRLQLDLPTENLAVILSLTSILDFIVTAVNIFSAQSVIAAAAKEKD